MRNFHSISIDTETNTSWVQTGATLGEFYYAIGQTSKTLAFPAGVCLTVGVGGHFSGGGYSMLSRKHGLSADQIVDAKIINFDGQILDRESMGEDLFWAIRGGGSASFGIVISFKVKLVVIPEIVTVFQVRRTLEQKLVKLVHRWQYIADKIDGNLTIKLRMYRGNKSVDGNTTTIGADFNCLFLGRVDDLLPLMQDRFPELGLSSKDCVEVTWAQSHLLFEGFTSNEPLKTLKGKGTAYNYFKGKSDFATKPIPEEILGGLLKLADEDPFYVEFEFSPFGGKMNEISETEIPFPHRAGNIFLIQYCAIWSGNPGKEESEGNLKWIHKMYDYMEPYVSESPRSAYYNYMDLEIGKSDSSVLESNYKRSSVWGFKYFKNNFRKLAFVKTKVDPTNFFRNEQSIPVMSQSEMEEYIDSETYLSI